MLYYFLIFLALVIIFGTNWALDKAQINNFEQILLTLTNSVSTASNEMIISFIKDSIPNQKLQIRFCIKRIQEICRKKIPLF